MSTSPRATKNDYNSVKNGGDLLDHKTIKINSDNNIVVYGNNNNSNSNQLNENNINNLANKIACEFKKMEISSGNQIVEPKKKKKDKKEQSTKETVKIEIREKKHTTLKVIQDDELTSEMLKRKYLKTTNTEDDFYSNRNETGSGYNSKSNVFTSKHSKNIKFGNSDSNVGLKGEKEGLFNAKKSSTVSYATQGMTSTKNERIKTISNKNFDGKSKKGLSKNTEISRKLYHTNALNSKASSKRSKVTSKNSDGEDNVVFNRKYGKPILT